MKVEVLPIERRLRLLGFREVAGSSGSAWETTIADVHVLATHDSCRVLFIAERCTPRTLSFVERWAPIELSVQDIAHQLWKFALAEHPELLPGSIRWVQEKLSRLDSMRPILFVSRQALRKTLSGLQEQLGAACVQDVLLSFQPVDESQRFGMLMFSAEHGLLRLVAQGLWVGQFRVRARDLFAVLQGRFRTDTVGLSVTGRGLAVGHWHLQGRWEEN